MKKFRCVTTFKTDINTVCKKSFGELHSNTMNRIDKFKELGYNVKYIWESDWKYK
jgi:hypothetical protein